MSQSEHQPAPSSWVYQYLLAFGSRHSKFSFRYVHQPDSSQIRRLACFHCHTSLSFPQYHYIYSLERSGDKALPCRNRKITPEYVPFLTFSSRRMGQNQLFENIKYSVTTWHNIFTHSTSLIIYKTLFWRLKNQSCDLNELSLDAGINFYFSLINLICVINFIIKVYTLQCGTLLNFWNKGLSV